MNERVKVFTYVSSERSPLIESEFEDDMNDWLAKTKGTLAHISQSESERPSGAEHITLCVWYVPEQPASS